MFTAGIIAFLQIIFIPGFILIKTLKIKTTNLIELFIYSFALSWLVNYIYAFTLFSLGLYSRISILLLLALETIILVNYLIKAYNNPVKNYFEIKLIKTKNFFNTSIIIFSVLILFIYFYLYLTSLGGVFSLWDAVNSWEPWSKKFFNGQMPTGTFLYPQLITVGWSVTYMIIGNSDIEAFAKAAMPLFPICTLFLFALLAYKTRKFQYILALFLYGTLQVCASRPYITDGFMDLPVAFFGFLTLYSYLKNKENYNIHSFWLTITFACTAALTKQAGLYILSLSIFFACKTLLFSPALGNAKRRIVNLSCMILFASVLVGSWYIPRHLEVKDTASYTEVGYFANNVHGNKSYTERTLNAYTIISAGIERVTFAIFSDVPFVEIIIILVKLIFFLFILSVLLSLFNKELFLITLLVPIPFTMIWLFIYSYDHRNLVLAFPYFALSSSFGFFTLPLLNSKIESFKSYKFSINKKMFLLLPLLAIVVATSQLFITNEKLRTMQLEQKNKLGPIKLNREIGNFFANNEPQKILTDYKAWSLFPKLQNLTKIIETNTDPSLFQKLVVTTKPKYLLISNDLQKSSQKFIDKLLENKTLTLIVTQADYNFFAVSNP